MMKKSNKSSISDHFLFYFGILIVFFGVIILTGKLTGNDVMTMFPEFSWDMMMDWEDFKKFFNPNL